MNKFTLLFLFIFSFSISFSQYIEREFFVKVKDNTVTLNQIEELVKTSSFNSEFNLSKPFILDNPILQQTFVLKFTNTVDADLVMQKLNSSPLIDYSEQIPDYQLFYTPNDIQPQQWNLQTILAELAWNYSTGSSNIITAMVDDAVLMSHQDLSTKIWVNPGEIPANGIDDDGNGYVDDVNGWDAADNDNDPNPFNPTNSYFTHGTHCAGITAAATDNATGIAAIGFNTMLMPVKIGLNSTSGLANAYLGVQYAIASNADIISMSWGGTGYSNTYQAIINQAYNQGIVCIAAAGNSNTSAPMYPASYNNVISVGATDITDTRASFSNYGSTIDVMAPGVSIYSTLAGNNAAYGNLSGTSMACPLVSGIAALMLSHDPTLTPADVESCLESTCDNIDSQNPTFIGMLGAGRVNAYEAMRCIKPITASFTSNMNEICQGTTIQFFDQSNNNPTSWNWSFPGGTPSTSTAQNPVVTYNTSGQYNVTLIVSNAQGTDTLTISNYVIVAPPTATTSGNTTVLAGTAVNIPITFTGTAPWSFSYTDGTNTFNVNGVTSNPYLLTVAPTVTTTYTLLTVSDTNCTGTASGSHDVIIVTGAPCQNIIVNGDFENGNTGFTSGFPYACQCQVGSICVASEARDKCQVTQWIDDVWDHTYGTSVGNYLIIDGANLMVWEQQVSVVAGQSYRFSMWQIREISDNSFNNSTQTFDILINGNVEQTFTTNSAPSQQWTNYQFFWTSPITATVPLTIDQVAGAAYNDHGIDDIEFGPCVSGPVCNLQASFTDSVNCLGSPTYFFDTSIDSLANIIHWEWDFGDGNSASGIQNPTHQYTSPGNYTVTLIITNDAVPFCSDTVSQLVTIGNTFNVIAGYDSTICVGDNVQLEVIDELCGFAPYSYTWSPSIGLNNANIPNPIASPLVTTNYIVTVTDSAGNTATDTVTITVNTGCCVTQVDIGGQINYCLGDTLQLVNNSTYNTNAFYWWDYSPSASPQSSSGYSPSQTVVINGTGTYTIYLEIQDSCGFNSGTMDIHIFNPPPTPNLIDTILCLADSFQINSSPISTYQYNWTPAINLSNPSVLNTWVYGPLPASYVVEITDPITGCSAYDSISITGGVAHSLSDTFNICMGDSIWAGGAWQYTSGNYIDTYINSTGCDSTINTTVNVAPPSSVQIINKDTSISNCGSVPLQAIGANTYNWYPVDDLSCSNCANPIATPQTDVLYYVIGNPGVCQSSDTIMITVTAEEPLIIPNVFSPNADYQNDYFNILGGCITAINKKIYNRWGQLMFESALIEEGWDGTTRSGEKCPDGTYFYIFEVTHLVAGTEQIDIYKGSLSLFR